MKKIITIIAVFTFFLGNSQEKKGVITNVFSFVNAYDYQQNDELFNNNPEQIILANEGIKLITRLEIREEETYCFIKAFNSTNNTIEIHSFLFKNNQWNIINKETNLVTAVKSILKVVNADLLFDFANENQSFYKEIDRIKSFSKDKKGILDVFKLAKVVQDNKEVLQKLN